MKYLIHTLIKLEKFQKINTGVGIREKFVKDVWKIIHIIMNQNEYNNSQRIYQLQEMVIILN